MPSQPAKLCAVLFALGILALALVDNLRPWRGLQVEFYALELEQTKASLQAVRGRLDSRLELEPEDVERTRERAATQRPEIIRLEEKLRTLHGKEERARMRLEEARYVRAKAHPPSTDATALAVLDQELRDARRELETWQEERAEQANALSHLAGDLAITETPDEGLNALEQRMTKLQRGAFLRRWPLLALFDPLLKTQTVTLLDLPLPAPHAGAPRVDRCTTCHLGAPRPGFEDFPTPFASHPHLDLFVGAGSPHSYDKVGCTLCHGGEGRATAFDRAGHLPRDAAQEATWRQRWDYRAERLPPRPIVPSALVEAGCVACHQAPRSLPAASTLEAGRRLGQRLGCGSCHLTLAEDPTLPQRGPSLRRLAAKTRPSWVARFLDDPGAFRPTTWMPHGFQREGTDEHHLRRREAEINAVVTYLFAHSQATILEPPPAGDAETGRVLFANVGCTACHLLAPEATRDTHAPGFARLQGPHLARMGNKAEADWLYTWLRNPQAHRPDTPMPNLRLDAAEAASLTAFLITQGDADWENTWKTRELPPIDTATRDQLVLEHLEHNLPLRQSAARFDAMDDDERTLYLGERTLAQHGCHGCHAIPGFEEFPPPDVPLPPFTPQTAMSWSDEASTESPHGPPHSGLPSRQSTSAVKAPRYELTVGERTALATWQLASQVDAAPAHLPQVDPALTAGRQLIEHLGCRGCHPMEGLGGFPSTVEPGSQNPPTLVHEGRRVRPSWLFAFLREPGEHPVRPWLQIRMPRFALSDSQLTTLVRYFMARDGASLLDLPPPPAQVTEQTVGAVAFNLLQCARCHDGREETGGLQVLQLAPSYLLAPERLRAPWVEEWILDPTQEDPNTSMPALAEGENDTSFLLRSLNAPMFSPQKARLQRVLEDEEALTEFLTNPQRVAQALRAYIWSLGEQGTVR